MEEEELQELNRIIFNIRTRLSYYKKYGKSKKKPKKIAKKTDSPKPDSFMQVLKSKGYAEVSILLAIKKLSATEQELLAKCYGDNFDTYRDERVDEVEEKILEKAIKKIEYQLEGIERLLPQSIYEYEKLSMIRKVYIDLVIKHLDAYEKEYLKQVFGEDLLTYQAPPKAKKEVDNIIQKICYVIISMQTVTPEDASVRFLSQTSYHDLITVINNKLPSNYRFYLNGILNQKFGKDLNENEIENLRRIYAEIMQNLITKKGNTRKKEK